MLLVNSKPKRMTIRHFSFFCSMLFCFSAFYVSAQGDRKIKLIFAGDIMVHKGQLSSAEVKKGEVFDFSKCFQFVSPVLHGADLVIGNLETTLPGEPPYAGYPTFRTPDIFAKELRYAGFDVLMTSNNHSNDAKFEGLIQTIEALDQAGFYQTGTFQSEEERNAFYPLVVYKKGFKLVFLNYTYGTNNPSDYPPAIINRIDEELMEEDMAEARALKPDAIIVMMHWGKEYLEDEREEEQLLAKKLFEWGATLVVGAHPHVVQPVKMEQHNSGDHLVAYSMGNFISGQVKPKTDGSILLEVELAMDDEKERAFVTDYHFIPIWRYIQRKGKKTYLTIPIAPFEKENSLLEMAKYDRRKMLAYAKYIRKKMKTFDCSERKITLRDIGQLSSSGTTGSVATQ